MSASPFINEARNRIDIPGIAPSCVRIKQPIARAHYDDWDEVAVYCAKCGLGMCAITRVDREVIPPALYVPPCPRCSGVPLHG